MRRGKHKDRTISLIIDATLLGEDITLYHYSTWSALALGRGRLASRYILKWWRNPPISTYPIVENVGSEEAIKAIDENWKHRFNEYRKGPL